MGALARGDQGSDRALIVASYLYLALPIFIFIFGWLRLPLALLVASALGAGTFLSLRNYTYVKTPGLFSLRFLLPVFVMVVAWVVLSGIGGLGYQNSDFGGKNPVFRDLVARPWPVTYPCPAGVEAQTVCGHFAALVYFFTYWLPSALIGKLAGWKVANYTLVAWSVAGVLLSILLVSRYIRKARLLAVAAFILWSGMDILGTYAANWPGLMADARVDGSWSIHKLLGELLALVLDSRHLEWWAGQSLWQYSSVTTQLFWVFNSAVPAWVTTLLLLNEEDRRSMVFTYALLLPYAPLPAIGLLPLLLYKMIHQASPEHPREALSSRAIRTISSSMSFQNTLGAFALCSVELAFFGIQAGNNPHGLIWQFVPFGTAELAWYVLFCVLEFGAFGALLLSVSRQKALVVIVMLVLLVLPVYKYGGENDFVTRASIPSLLILGCLGLRAMFEDPRWQGTLRVRVVLYALLAVMIVGSITPFHELMRSRDAIVSANGFPAPDETLMSYQEQVDRLDFSKTQRLATHAQDTFFFRVLARP